MKKVLEEAPISDYKTIAKFIAKHNNSSKQRCLHCLMEENALYEEIQDLLTRKEVYFVQLKKDGKLLGLLGCDCDDVRERIWFWGPFIEQTEDWGKVSEELYNYFLKITPKAKEFVAYTDTENKRTRSFFTNKGFKEKGESTFLYELAKENFKKDFLKNEAAIILFEPSYEKELKRIHDIHFPGAYYSTEEMIKLDAQKNKIFLKINEKKDVEGYILVSETGSGRGYIHFLAVDESQRGQGLGLKLISKGIQWLLEEQQVPAINLSVNEKNNAQHFYEKLGFQFLYSGVGAFLKPV